MDNKIAIVIVTYKRRELLGKLLDSLLDLTVAPWKIVLVDNNDDAEVAALVEAYQQKIANGQTACTWPCGAQTFVYAPQQDNAGGAGGFYVGVRTAYDLGAQWFWLIDDDVVALPDALEKFERWMPNHGLIQGSRLDYDGGMFYWQYRFVVSLGIYNPFATARFDSSGFKPTNAACFEGCLVSREVVKQIGLPDPRFFVYWDDCVYGYLASKVTDSVVVSDVVLQRTREMKNWEISGTRQLGSSSDATRFYIMCNRGYMARYLKLHGDFNRVGFALGTFFSFAKEFIRLVAVDRAHFSSGWSRLVAGWRESRVLLRDPVWEPMPSLDD